MKGQARTHRGQFPGKKVKTDTKTKCVEAPRDRISVPLTGTGPAGRFANGDVQCPGWGDRIDRSVCITRSVRHQEKCAGATCPLNL